MKKINLFLMALQLFFVANAKGITREGVNSVLQKYTNINFQSQPVKVGYGETFKLDLVATNRKTGKIKQIRLGNPRFQIAAQGATKHLNKLTIQRGSIAKKDLYAVKIIVKQHRLFKKDIVDTLVHPINFAAKLELDLKGYNGSSGRHGTNHWGRPLLGRDGNNGGMGEDGEDGTDGKSVSLKVKKEFDVYLGREIYFVYVKEAQNKYTYLYRWDENEGGIFVTTNGGHGGSGGQGGRGGNGKYGEYVTKNNGTVKYKEAGAGGNGGSGGNGGNGGDSGNIDVLVHDNAVLVTQYLHCSANGGCYGSGGDASGNYGRAGSAPEGQYQPSDGHPGNEGLPGISGRNGIITLHVGFF
jgi:hypothetical protein